MKMKTLVHVNWAQMIYNMNDKHINQIKQWIQEFGGKLGFTNLKYLVFFMQLKPLGIVYLKL